MSYIHGRLASSSLILLIAAGLAAPAFAADTTYTVVEGQTVAAAGTSSPVVNASPAAGDTFTVNNAGTIRSTSTSNLSRQAIGGNGAGTVVINNDGRIQGRLTFGSATGSVILHNNTDQRPSPNNPRPQFPDAVRGWATSGATVLGSGDDLIDNTADGAISTQGTTSFDFGAGNDRFTNTGRLIIGLQAGSSALTLTGLETFDNSGLILLGSTFGGPQNPGQISDFEANDVLNAQGVAFTGSEGSRIAMDVNLGGVAQTDCSALTAADCVDFTGGSTAGSTLLTIQDATLNPKAGALNDGIVLIVGASAAGDFSLDPNSDHYVTQTSQGPVLQKGFIAYRLVYDADAKKHMLVSNLADEAFQGATFAASAQETWRATAGSWFDRQADLRATPGGLESSNGVWARASFQSGERSLDASYTHGSITNVYDVDHKQRIGQALVGVDVLNATSGDTALVLGGLLGFVRSDVDYDATPTEVVYSGFVGGLYASYLSGPLFVDALFDANVLSQTADAPNFRLSPGVKLTQNLHSLGGRLEAGWKIPLGAVSLEPLAGVSYVKTTMEDIDLPDGVGSYGFADGYKSLRVGGGLRAAMDSHLLGLVANYSLTARYWNESKGDNVTTATLGDGVTAFPLVDDVGGGYSDIQAGVNLYSSDGGLSAFASLGGQFASDYHAIDGSIGVRLRW